MADNDDDDLPDDEPMEEVDNGMPPRIPSTTRLARLALERHFTPSFQRSLRSGALPSIIIEVPTVGWVTPMISVARAMFEPAHVVAVKERNRFDTDDGALAALAIDHPVVGISQDPDDLLPRSLIAACDLRIKVRLDSELVYALARACLRGRVGRRFSGLNPAGLDFAEICSCIAAGSNADVAYRRLKRAIDGKHRIVELDTVPRLEDVHGYGEAKSWALDLKGDLADLKLGRISARDADRGCVFFGPPGTGKSLLARVIAKACEVPFFSVSMGDFFRKGDGHLGSVVRAIRETFEQARAQKPAIVFIDELDSFPHRAKLSNHNRDWWTPVVNELLALLDGSAADRSGVVVIGATNSLSSIDDALLRKGRLERAIYIGPPSEAGLAGILRFYLRDDLLDVDLVPLVQSASGSTGADVEEWVRGAKRRARRAGRPLQYADLEAQILAPDRRSADVRHRVAVHEAGHAVAIVLLGVGNLERVTILPRGASSGQALTLGQQKEISVLSELENTVVALLAGRAAEFIVTGEFSTAAGGDSQSDIALATNMIATWHTSLGLSDRPTWRGPPDQATALLSTDWALRLAVDQDLEKLWLRATKLVRNSQALIDTVAEALLRQRTLSGEQVRHLMAGS